VGIVTRSPCFALAPSLPALFTSLRCRLAGGSLLLRLLLLLLLFRPLSPDHRARAATAAEEATAATDVGKPATVASAVRVAAVAIIRTEGFSIRAASG
jgi:hypothetical protein